MNKTEAVEKFNELYQASEIQDPEQCALDILEELIVAAVQDTGGDPDKMTEAANAAELIYQLTSDENSEDRDGRN